MKFNLKEKDFIRYGEIYDIVPLYITIAADGKTSVDIYKKLEKEDSSSLLLESDGEKGRYSFIGYNLKRTFEAQSSDPDILQELKEYISCNRAPVDGLPPFSGGLVGYLGYSMIEKWQKLFRNSKKKLRTTEEAASVMMVCDEVISKEEGSEKIQIIENVRTDGEEDLSKAYYEASRRLEKRAKEIELTGEDDKAQNSYSLSEIEPEMEKETFMSMVEKGKEHIVNGDICQVVLSQRFKAESDIPSLNIYEELKSSNPSPYMFYVKLPQLELIGSSPEVLVKNRSGHVVTRPLAGTRRRGKNEVEDKALREELLSDQKELAEHLMLVDLARNDLGRVCKTGSVEVTELMEVDNYSQVMHIVSQVEGQLRDDKDSFDLLRSSFPAGTLSGAPKIRAMEIIEELEPLPRGPYGGAVGYIGYNGDMDTCIAIRTLVRKGRNIFIQCGAGIVYDSQPELEYKETLNKGRALFEALKRAKEMKR